MNFDPKIDINTATPFPLTHPMARRSWPRQHRQPDKVPASAKELLSETLQRHWPFFKNVFKEQYMVLTDDDLTYSAGHEDELLEHLEQKTCHPRAEFEKLIATQDVPTG